MALGTDLGALLAGAKLLPDTDTNLLVERNWQSRPRGVPNAAWENLAWRGLSVPVVQGIRNVTMSPFSPIATLGQLVNEMGTIVQRAADLMTAIADGTAIDVLALNATIGSLDVLGDLLRLYLRPAELLNASGSGMSVTPGGLGVSVSFPNPFPSVVNATSVGSTGSITVCSPPPLATATPRT